jgi:hypothetical protein
MGGGTRCKLFTDRNRDSRVAVAPEDRMVEHKEALEKHMARRRKDLSAPVSMYCFYDLTCTYFEGDAEEVDKADHGHSRDHGTDCKQLVLALVVTPEGFPLSYEKDLDVQGSHTEDEAQAV